MHHSIKINQDSFQRLPGEKLSHAIEKGPPLAALLTYWSNRKSSDLFFIIWGYQPELHPISGFSEVSSVRCFLPR